MANRIIGDIMRATRVTTIDDMGDPEHTDRSYVADVLVRNQWFSGKIEKFEEKNGYIVMKQGPDIAEVWIAVDAIDAVRVTWSMEEVAA